MVVLTRAQTLQELAGRLSRHGLRARLDQPIGRPPTLHVSNPAVPGLDEDICLEEGHFWWPWGDPIAPADDLTSACASIRRVLGVHSSEVHSTPSSTG